MVRVFRPPDTSQLLAGQEQRPRTPNGETQAAANLRKVYANDSASKTGNGMGQAYRAKPSTLFPNLNEEVDHMDNRNAVQLRQPSNSRVQYPQAIPTDSRTQETNYYPLPIAVPAETKVVLDDRNLQSLMYNVKDTSKEQKRLLQTVLQLQSDMHEHEKVQNSLLREESGLRKSLSEHYHQLSLVVEGLRDQINQIGNQMQSDREASYRHLDMVGSDISESKQVSMMVKSLLDKSEAEMQRQVARVEARLEKETADMSHSIQELKFEAIAQREKLERQRQETSEVAQSLRRDISGVEQQVTQLACNINGVRDQIIVAESRLMEKLTTVDAVIKSQLQTQQHNLTEASKLLTEAIQTVQTDARQSIRSLEQTWSAEITSLTSNFSTLSAQVDKLDGATDAITKDVDVLHGQVKDSLSVSKMNAKDLASLYRVVEKTQEQLEGECTSLRQRLKETSKDLASGLSAVKGNLESLQEDARCRQQVLERQVLASQIKAVQENEALKDELKKDIKNAKRPFIVV